MKELSLLKEATAGGDKNIENISRLIWDRESKKVKTYFLNSDRSIDSFLVFANCSIVLPTTDCTLSGSPPDCTSAGRTL